jgi:hypothetical protein
MPEITITVEPGINFVIVACCGRCDATKKLPNWSYQEARRNLKLDGWKLARNMGWICDKCAAEAGDAPTD